MQMNGGGGGGFQSEINVTPLVDVVLVLLIILMVVVPLTMRGYDVDIPEAPAAAQAPQKSEERVVLSIDVAGCPVVEPPGSAGLPSGCAVRINDEIVAVTDLAPRIAELFAPREAANRVLFLSAQDRLNYEGVMRIVDVAKSGVDGLRIGLVTDR